MKIEKKNGFLEVVEERTFISVLRNYFPILFIPKLFSDHISSLFAASGGSPEEFCGESIHTQLEMLWTIGLRAEDELKSSE